MPYADFVKIDCRDVRRQGATLVQLARQYGARLVAERVSDPLLVEECRGWGFDLLQGDVLGPAITLARRRRSLRTRRLRRPAAPPARPRTAGRGPRP